METEHAPEGGGGAGFWGLESRRMQAGSTGPRACEHALFSAWEETDLTP